MTLATRGLKSERDTRFVADTGLAAALPLSLSARSKRKSDRRRHEARGDLVARRMRQ